MWRAKIFGPALLQPARMQCLRLSERFFIVDWYRIIMLNSERIAYNNHAPSRTLETQT